MGKFHGDISTLKSIVFENGLVGKWSERDDIDRLITNDGGILIRYKSTGALVCQGKGNSIAKIKEVIKELDGKSIITQDGPIDNIETNPSLFIVYGHDENSRDQLELGLSKLGIDAFILAKSSGNGKTIIQALEAQVGKSGIASVGIVLLTPDDEGYSKKEGITAIKNRARQNVILEMGMLISKLGLGNTIILVKGDIEHPSDTRGIIYLPFEYHVKEVMGKLVKRLESAGFKIDHKKALEATF